MKVKIPADYVIGPSDGPWQRFLPHEVRSATEPLRPTDFNYRAVDTASSEYQLPRRSRKYV